MKRIPLYNYLPATELPPYQLFKRWQKAMNTTDMSQFGFMSKDKMLSDIELNNPKLLNAIK
jgi:hypothetical protein